MIEPFLIGFSRTPKTSMPPLGTAIIVFGIMVLSLLVPIEPLGALGPLVIVIFASFGAYTHHARPSRPRCRNSSTGRYETWQDPCSRRSTSRIDRRVSRARHVRSARAR